MESAETATNGYAIVGGSTVGVNLCGGGKFSVNGPTTAYALFVQDANAELGLGGTSPSLDIARNVYISQGRTLTLSLANGVNSGWIKADHFADDGQIVAAEGFTRSEIVDGTITVTRDGAAAQTVIYNITGNTAINDVAPEDVAVKASDENGDPLPVDITGAFDITPNNEGGVDVVFAPGKPEFSDVVVEGESVAPMKFDGDKVVFGLTATNGLWYAVAASSDINAMSGDTQPSTTPVMATGDALKLEAPTFQPPLMFYKVLVAPSKAAMDFQGEE